MGRRVSARRLNQKEYQGREVASMRGRSVSGLLFGTENEIYDADEPVGAEMGGGKRLRLGDYKAIQVPAPYGQNKWQLFNLSNDPGETQDLSKENPKKMRKLKTAWKQYANDVGVVEVGN